MTSDALGRLTSVDEMLEYPSAGIYATTTYSYDVLDDLTGVTQGAQTPRTFDDSLKRLKQATNPESGTTNYTYDPNSNLFTKQDARLITTTYGYDALNRAQTRTYTNDPQFTPQVTYSSLSRIQTDGSLKSPRTSRLVTIWNTINSEGSSRAGRQPRAARRRVTQPAMPTTAQER